MDSRREKCPRAAIVSLEPTFMALALYCGLVLTGFIVVEGTPSGLSSEKAKVAWTDRRPRVFLDSEAMVHRHG